MMNAFFLILAATILGDEPVVLTKDVRPDLASANALTWQAISSTNINANCTACHAESRDVAYHKFLTTHAWADARQDWANPVRSWRALSRTGGTEDLGAVLTPVDDAVRAQLNLPEGRGLVVTGVVAEGRADKAGLKANDILLTLADKPLVKPDDLLAHLKAALGRHGGVNPEAPVALTLLRAGKPMTIQVKPEARVALGTVVQPTPDYYIGTPSNPIDETLRTHLGLAEGQGLIVSAEPTDGTPAARAGIKHNDILLTFDGQALADIETLRARIQKVGPKPAKVGLLRAGKPMEVTVTPEPRKPEPETTYHKEMLDLITAEGTVRLLQDVPVLNRLYTTNQLQNPMTYDRVNSPPAAPDLTKKIDDLTAQVQALTKAVDDLRKQVRPGESK
ncbi:MAG: mucD 4 [Planctomycetota bacterium]|nr:mucD 4 [Planctomycetota bacterium]